MAKKKETTQLSDRERRRQRRMRNQIAAYITAFVFVAGLATGAFFGIRYVIEMIEDKRQEEALAAEMAALAEAEAAEDIEEEDTEEVEEVEEYTEDDLLEEMVDAGIGEMTLEDKVAGLFLTSPEALTGVGKVIQAGEGTEKALAEYAVGGLVYDSDNIQSEEQFTQMLTDTLPKSKYPLFFIMDGEHSLTEDLSVYGINMEFADKGEDAEPMTFRTVTLPSLLGDASEEGLATAQIGGEADAIADACLEAWEGGAELLYVPEGFAEAYEGLLAKVQEDEELEDKLTETLEKIYRVKYRGRLEE